MATEGIDRNRSNRSAPASRARLHRAASARFLRRVDLSKTSHRRPTTTFSRDAWRAIHPFRVHGRRFVDRERVRTRCAMPSRAAGSADRRLARSCVRSPRDASVRKP